MEGSGIAAMHQSCLAIIRELQQKQGTILEMHRLVQAIGVGLLDIGLFRQSGVINLQRTSNPYVRMGRRQRMQQMTLQMLYEHLRGIW